MLQLSHCSLHTYSKNFADGLKTYYYFRSLNVKTVSTQIKFITVNLPQSTIFTSVHLFRTSVIFYVLISSFLPFLISNST